MNTTPAAYSWADRITISRMFGAPLLLWVAYAGHSRVFLVIAVVGLVTDFSDGRVARWLNNSSEYGARLDSRADLMFYSAAFVGLLLLFPGAFAAEWRVGLVVGFAYALPIAFGLLKFRRLTSYHTVLARVALCAVATSFFFWLWLDAAGPLRIAVTILVLSAIEEVAITCMLAAPRDDVSHIFLLLSPGFRRSKSCLPKQLEL